MKMVTPYLVPALWCGEAGRECFIKTLTHSGNIFYSPHKHKIINHSLKAGVKDSFFCLIDCFVLHQN